MPPYDAIGMKYRLTCLLVRMWCRKTWFRQFGQVVGAISPRSLASPAPQPKITTMVRLPSSRLGFVGGGG